MKISDYLTHIGNREDVPFLRIPLFDVNMRLFHGLQAYQNIIRECIRHIKTAALMEFEDYPAPYGSSGANVGLPFNIIGYVVGRGTSHPECRIMLNPHILEYSIASHVALSNCGSIRLPKPIRIRRSDWVTVSYFNEQGQPRKGCYVQGHYGDTIQHEVEHNRGILITDRPIQEV